MLRVVNASVNAVVRAPVELRTCLLYPTAARHVPSWSYRPQQSRGYKVSTSAWTDTPTAKHRTHEQVAEYMQKMFDLESKIAFVTGASGAIGSATALALARCGADVVVSDLESKLPRLQELASEISALGKIAVPAVCDVRDQASVNSAVEIARKEFGRIDILVANAGVLGDLHKPQDMSDDNWREVFAVNVDGVFHTTKACYPLLKIGGKSKVVILGSIAGMYGYGHQPAYCAAKGALLPLGKSLALAWAKEGINVNLVCPGATNSPFTKKILSNPDKVAYMLDRIPLSRLAEPEDIVGPVVFFASHAADYITGTHLIVDGGGTARAMAQ